MFFISKQCSIIPSNSSLPSDANCITDNRLSNVTFSAENIGKVIQNLNYSIAHGHDNISIHMLKICVVLFKYRWTQFLSKLFLLVCFLLNGQKRKYCSHSQKERQTKY